VLAQVLVKTVQPALVKLEQLLTAVLVQQL
jgi:hypothetical protein